MREQVMLCEQVGVEPEPFMQIFKPHRYVLLVYLQIGIFLSCFPKKTVPLVRLWHKNDSIRSGVDRFLIRFLKLKLGKQCYKVINRFDYFGKC